MQGSICFGRGSMLTSKTTREGVRCASRGAGQPESRCSLMRFQTGPWQKLGMDFFDLKGKCYILICDYFSKFPFMFSCKTSWASLKDRLIDLFSNEGFPKEIISDNGLPFQESGVCRISLQPRCQTYYIITPLSPE